MLLTMSAPVGLDDVTGGELIMIGVADCRSRYSAGLRVSPVTADTMKRSNKETTATLMLIGRESPANANAEGRVIRSTALLGESRC